MTCDGTMPAISWFEDKGQNAIEMLRFQTIQPEKCSAENRNQLGVVRMDITLSRPFTQVEGSFAVHAPPNHVLGDKAACDPKLCTDASPWGHAVGGILFGTVDTVIKRGGELGASESQGTYETAAVEVPPTTTLRMEVSGLNPAMAVILSDLNVRVYESVEDAVLGLFAYYDFDTAPRAKDVLPSQVPAGVARAERTASCTPHCPEWTPMGIAGGALSFVKETAAILGVNSIDVTDSNAATLAFWFEADGGEDAPSAQSRVDLACARMKGAGPPVCISLEDNYVVLTSGR